MKKVIMIYPNFYDRNGVDLLVGGVETYLLNLSKVVDERGYKPVIVQAANKEFYKRYKDIEIYGVALTNRGNTRKLRKKMIDHALSLAEENKDIIIFGSDYLYQPIKYKRTLVIQHGIAWDLPLAKENNRFKQIIKYIKAKIRVLTIIYRSYKTKYFVCVDYNFINFCRNFFNVDKKKLWIIPNFVKEQNNISSIRTNFDINIVFARRFVWYRGTLLFAEAIKKLINKYDNVNITLAGEGPDEIILKEMFKVNEKVKFTKYHPDDSVEFHSNHHIAVVPSLGSEGTSLSLAEAMAAGCAVIATNVGGMTNMIIDGFNGRLVNPDVDELYYALCELVEEKDLREKLADNAKKTANDALRFETWEKRWSEVLNFLDDIE